MKGVASATSFFAPMFHAGAAGSCVSGFGCYFRRVSNAASITSKREWTAVRCASLDDMRTQNILFWQAQGAAMIRRAAWELVEEYWQANKLDPDELRFSRSVTSVRRA
jgi:hypothetical protein